MSGFDSKDGGVGGYGFRYQHGYYSSSNSNCSSLSSSSSESDYQMTVGDGDLDADADSLTCKQSDISSTDHLGNDRVKAVCTVSHLYFIKFVMSEAWIYIHKCSLIRIWLSFLIIHFLHDMSLFSADWHSNRELTFRNRKMFLVLKRAGISIVSLNIKSFNFVVSYSYVLLKNGTRGNFINVAMHD